MLLSKKVDQNSNGKVEFEEFSQLWQLIQSNEYAEQVGGMAKLKVMRMQDVGKYPEPTGKWQKTHDSGFYGSTGGGVYKKDSKKGPPPKKNISDLP